MHSLESIAVLAHAAHNWYWLVHSQHQVGFASQLLLTKCYTYVLTSITVRHESSCGSKLEEDTADLARLGNADTHATGIPCVAA
jgi:hypothetical protein